MTACPKELPVQPTLADIAREAVKKHGADIDKATTAALRRLRADKFLYESLVDDLVNSAVRGAVYEARASINSNIKRPPAPPANECPRGADVIAAVNDAHYWLNFLMPCRKPMKECTRAELIQDASRSHEQANGYRRRAKFFDAVAKQLKDGEAVGDAFEEKDLRKIWDGIGGK